MWTNNEQRCGTTTGSSSSALNHIDGAVNRRGESIKRGQCRIGHCKKRGGSTAGSRSARDFSASSRAALSAVSTMAARGTKHALMTRLYRRSLRTRLERLLEGSGPCNWLRYWAGCRRRGLCGLPLSRRDPLRPVAAVRFQVFELRFASTTRGRR